MSISININDRDYDCDVDDDTPLLWAIRDTAALLGTKFGCGVGACGACTVLVDGVATRSCVFPISVVAGKRVTTIEGLSQGSEHPVQQAWTEESVPQCGYCQSGMIMAAAALIEKDVNPSDADIDQAMTNICRCGTYPRIRKAIHRAVRATGEI